MMEAVIEMGLNGLSGLLRFSDFICSMSFLLDFRVPAISNGLFWRSSCVFYLLVSWNACLFTLFVLVCLTHPVLSYLQLCSM